MLKRLKKLVGSGPQKKQQAQDASPPPFFKKLADNLAYYQKLLDRSGDINYRSFQMNTASPTPGVVIYIDNMINEQSLEQHVLAPLTGEKINMLYDSNGLAARISKQLLEVMDAQTVSFLDEGMKAILAGNALLLVDGINQGWQLHIKLLDQRSIEESASETVIRGPRDAFVELLAVNTTLLRRRLKTHHLKMEKMSVGTYSRTDIMVAYLDGIVNPQIVAEVKKRVEAISLDGVLESNYIEEFIQDDPVSPFSQINATERPDKVTAGLLEGQVAILVDNTPFALLMPVTFPEFLHAAEDYYNRAIYATFTRVIRLAAVNMALLLPSLYIAVITFHQELLPTDLLLSIASGRERVPFPAFVEALLMETTFEILREAGVRLPRPVGQATSIVGALVIGNAAVTAGLVSPSMVIVVALTALASFIIPTVAGSYAVRLLRFPMMFFAAFLGLFGIMVALMAILIHLRSLRSFGVPYLAPISPLQVRGLKDFFVRAPWWQMIDRPTFVGIRNLQRQDQGQKPRPPQRKDPRHD